MAKNKKDMLTNETFERKMDELLEVLRGAQETTEEGEDA